MLHVYPKNEYEWMKDVEVIIEHVDQMYSEVAGILRTNVNFLRTRSFRNEEYFLRRYHGSNIDDVLIPMEDRQPITMRGRRRAEASRRHKEFLKTLPIKAGNLMVAYITTNNTIQEIPLPNPIYAIYVTVVPFPHSYYHIYHE